MSKITVFDVAKYILNKNGLMSAMKLQKLIYYSQAWSLVWDDKPLFDNNIEAWANGPVVRDLYDKHKGIFQVSVTDIESFSANELDTDQADTVDAILSGYGNKSAQWLSDQTHAETPWKNARIGLTDGDRGQSLITHESMAEYYSSLS